MKIRLKRDWACPHFSAVAGAVFFVIDKVAEALIQQGVAEVVEHVVCHMLSVQLKAEADLEPKENE